MPFAAEQLRAACPHIPVGTLWNLVHAQPTTPMEALRVNGVGSVIVGRMVGAGLIVIANPDDWPTPERKRQLVEQSKAARAAAGEAIRVRAMLRRNRAAWETLGRNLAIGGALCKAFELGAEWEFSVTCRQVPEWSPNTDGKAAP